MTLRDPPLYAATGKMPSTSGLARYARRISGRIAARLKSNRQAAAFMAFSRFVAPLSKLGSSFAPRQRLTRYEYVPLPLRLVNCMGPNAFASETLYR